MQVFHGVVHESAKLLSQHYHDLIWPSLHVRRSVTRFALPFVHKVYIGYFSTEVLDTTRWGCTPPCTPTVDLPLPSAQITDFLKLERGLHGYCPALNPNLTSNSTPSRSSDSVQLLYLPQG
jgi:hypothetical protein